MGKNLSVFFTDIITRDLWNSSPLPPCLLWMAEMPAQPYTSSAATHLRHNHSPPTQLFSTGAAAPHFVPWWNPSKDELPRKSGKGREQTLPLARHVQMRCRQVNPTEMPTGFVPNCLPWARTK